ncbi:LysE family translocator [Clostridium formicaceticum]|uniref:Leucine export protein LeuE n=1 Tax=Clostridium formicaceticum TaxID=1497 RepID=A0AAC9RN37_9CLOT|nr:LysE family transporter [Clostridium formicaceticum]AOY78064.1 lysine transporter LysE [Clostridium formicaceticum]ARE88704.1 leucine export protein LeuE [Clostridium formicaceticum]
MIFKGFKFGMLLQFAVGPVCIFIFQIASLRGFGVAATGVLGVTTIDGLYILAAIIGLASIIDRRNTKIVLKIFGFSVLFIFGISIILSVFSINLLPSLSLQNISNSSNVFFRAIILTVSNPLTIIFWAGVFSAKIAEESMTRRDIYAFGFGALLSTMFFLTLIALAGSFIKTFFSSYVIQILNLTVGILLLYFSIRMIFK